jgi:hypothetical protein
MALGVYVPDGVDDEVGLLEWNVLGALVCE